jgi:hypothetical protein
MNAFSEEEEEEEEEEVPLLQSTVAISFSQKTIVSEKSVKHIDSKFI